MKREDFKVVANFYTTNSLTYILFKDKVVGFVETYKDMFFKQVDKDKWESQKKKRLHSEVTNEAETFIKNFIKRNVVQAII